MTGPTQALIGDEPPPAEHALDRVDDRYVLLSYLGHGGMGVVFRARDRLKGEVVALKRMTDPQHGARLTAAPTAGSVAADHELERRRRLVLPHGFRTLAALRHPNIISVLDYGFAGNGEPFFTMELIERPRSLLEAAAGCAAPQKIDLIVQVLRALSYLHRRGVIHRDLKPSNVLVDDRVRVLDFGIAVPHGEAGRMSGTLSHMAPEVLRGEPATEAADLYAVGVMTYEILTGHHPFRGFIGEALRMAVIELEPEPLEASPGLAAIVGRLLAKDPAARPGDANETIDALIDAAALDAPRHTPATRESFLQAASFVGRIDEQRALSDAVTRLMSGRGGVWMVEGESGLGKTRLLDELRTLGLVAGAKVVRGQADSAARDSFALWREPLRHLLLGTQIDEAEARTLAALVPDIAELIDRPVTLSPANPQTARAQMLGAIAAVFERQRRTSPVMLLLEDLHWAREGLDVLRALAPSLPGLPVLIVGSFRGEEAPGLARSIPGASHLRLGPLARADIAALAESMLGATRPPLLDFLDRHTEGNVFFLVETVRALAEETGSLERIGERPLPDRLVTRGIEAMVARRLAKVPELARPVLAFSAVVGRTLDAPLLEDVFGAARVAAATALGTETAVLEVHDDRFRFAHDKFREHTLEALGAARRRELHAEVAAAIERVRGGGKAWAAALAYHHREAEQPDREAPFSALAGQAALEQGAYGDATRLLQRAIRLYEASAGADRAAELDLLLHYSAVLRAVQGWSSPEVKRIYDRVIELAAELGAQERTIPALHGLAASAAFRGDMETGRELATRLAQLAEDAGDVVGQIQAAVVLGNVAKWMGRYDEAERQCRRVIERYEPAQLPVHLSRYGWNPCTVSALTHALSVCIRGEPARAVQIYRDALAVAEATAHPFAITIALQIGAWVHHLRREVPETLHYAEAMARLAGEHGFSVFQALADALGGWAMVHGAQAERGLARLRAAVAAQRQVGGMMSSFYASLLADACLATGEIDEALVVVRSALADEVTTQERCYHPELYRLLAQASSLRGDVAQAEAALTRARSLAEAQGARLFELRARAAWSRLRPDRPADLVRLDELRRGLGDLPEALAALPHVGRGAEII